MASSNQPERPRAEPEIIPPDRQDGYGRRTQSWPPYGFQQDGMRGTQRVFVGRIGPFGFALMMLVIGLFAGVFLLTLIGAALLWIPVVAVLVLIAAISGVFRRR
ncbi:MAG TPA: hypothetical protein VH206_23950 [Xanthobacteraceae bacterium]|jgi:hypothetical protein|nr:hypothetical protein [Xanthobacteraceae bacterium]